jgi:hypothetical protein
MVTGTRNGARTRGTAAEVPAGATPKPARARKEDTVRVLRPVVRTITVPIRAFQGVPLVENKFSEKAMRQMADKQQHKTAGPRKAKDPEECFRGAMHLMPGAKATDTHPDVGFPAGGFRKAMIAAAPMVGLKRPTVKGAVFVVADEGGLVRIHYKKVAMREDAVRNESGVADLRYRPEFVDWWAEVRVQHDESLISADQVVNLMHRAGFSIGIGEGRPEKEGEWGRWQVMTVDGVDA